MVGEPGVVMDGLGMLGWWRDGGWPEGCRLADRGFMDVLRDVGLVGAYGDNGWFEEGWWMD